MSVTPSVGSMIKMLAGLLGTDDLTAWQEGFVQNLVERTDGGTRTSHLTGKQVEAVEQIFKKHFAA